MCSYAIVGMIKIFVVTTYHDSVFKGVVKSYHLLGVFQKMRLVLTAILTILLIHIVITFTVFNLYVAVQLIKPIHLGLSTSSFFVA